MSISARDVVPFTQARSNLSELADQVKAGAEKIITKNGESYVALIDSSASLRARSKIASSRRMVALPSRIWRTKASGAIEIALAER